MSIQQRLLQREPLDPWTLREQLCLASAVCRSGDQNWMSVSRALRAAGDPTRPQDWYQQKYCAAQYGALLEGADTPKRKKRTSEGAAETPQDAILKRLTAERIAELQKLMQDQKAQYAVLKEEISEVRSPGTSDARLRELLTGVEVARRQREREQQRNAQWLRDREECRRRSVDKSRRVSVTPPVGGLSPPASSPLLTSLLKNVSPGGTTVPSVSQMLHIPHPSTVHDAISPSASAPTLSMLLEKGREGVAVTPPAPPPPPPATTSTTDAAVIEQIKSELQQIEKSLQMGNMPSTTSPVLGAPLPLRPTLPPPPPADKCVPAVDIDDIEIKAEDVYAFSDMHLEIQPVSSIHKATLARTIEKPTFVKPSESEETPSSEEVTVDEPPQLLEVKEEILEPDVVTEPTDTEKEVINVEDSVALEDSVVDDTEPQIPAAETATEDLNPAVVEQEVVTAGEVDSEEPPLPTELLSEEQSTTEEVDEDVNVTGISEADLTAEAPSPDQQEDDTQEQPTEDVDDNDHVKEEPTSETEATDPAIVEEPEVDTDGQAVTKKEEEDWEDVPESVEAAEVVAGEAVSAGEEKPSEAEETHTETDDDTPMEVIREEEKGGRKRRDYSRRKAQLPSESRGWSGSESAAESAPPSPAPRAAAATPTPDPERDHRLWRKSVMLVYSRLCAHKYASLFLRPITDDLAPDYSLVVRRPMDLTTIKRNIDSGVIRTTAEFQRDVLLMLSNALFYNSSRHRVHQMAQEMHQEAAAQLGMLLQAQAHAALADSHAEPPARRPHPATKRKRLSSPHRAGPASPLAKRLREE